MVRCCSLVACIALLLLFLDQPASAAISTQSFGTSNLGGGTSDCPQMGVASSTCTFTTTDEDGDYAGGSTKASVTYFGALFASGTAVVDGPGSGVYSSAGSEAVLQDILYVNNTNFAYALISASFSGDGGAQFSVAPISGISQSAQAVDECTNEPGSACNSVTITSNGNGAAEFQLYATVSGGSSAVSQGMGTVQSGAFEAENLALAVYDTGGKLISYTEDDANIMLPGSLPVSTTPVPSSAWMLLSGLIALGWWLARNRVPPLLKPGNL